MLAIGLGRNPRLLCCLSWIGFDSHDRSLVRAWIALSPIIIAVLLAIGVIMGFVVFQPNESLVCLLFGSYVGTEHRPGFWLGQILSTPKNKVSRRLETLESGPLKVNDAVGNPIDIGAVIVWRVEDAAKALLEVASYASYVKVGRVKTALRRMVRAPLRIRSRRGSGAAGRTSGKCRDIDGQFARRGDAVIEALLQQLRARMEPIGVAVLERASPTCLTRRDRSAMLLEAGGQRRSCARRMI